MISLMRYYGGKCHLSPWIVSFFKPHRTYVEPFCGAASVLFKKERSYAEVLNDKSMEIVNLFQVLRDEKKSSRLIEMLMLTPYALDEYKLAYEITDDPVERARRLICRSMMGFFADSCNISNPVPGFRADAWRKGGIPAHYFVRYPEKLQFFIERIHGVIIHNMDAFDCIRKYDRPDTLFYLDPPYVQHSRTHPENHKYFFELSENEHRQLVDLCLALKGQVIISFYAHEIYDRFRDAGWRIETREYRGKTECLAIKGDRK